MIRDDATNRQIEAADPALSTWLSANAGSGKTRVLTDRVARLLLGGTRPENILCLTYTKAAASEMQNRLFQRLGEWAMMPNGELHKALVELGGETVITSDDVRTARTLFAAAIETPGGLKIQTIHSFCAGVLRRFPLEAEVSPQFREMEDRAAQLLREEVLDEMATGAQASAVAGFAQHYTGAEIGSFLASVTGRKAAFLNPPTDRALAQAFDIPKTLTETNLIGAIAGPDDLDTIRALIPICLKSGPTDQRAATKLQAIDCTTSVTMTDLTIMEDVFLFGKDAKAPYGAKIDSFPTKAVRAASPDLIEDLNDLMQRVEDGRDTRWSWLALAKTRALIAFGTPFVQAYETKKAQRAALDFDDLIGKAKALLEDPLVAQWVLFRLDGGVDHVLVDEAQDTSPDQWDIVRLLTQEFSTGIGANPDRKRTVFVVGDKKQSIYSFQGADPDGFDRMRKHFDGELAKVGKTLQNHELQYSFRSSQAILSLVDQTFQGDMAKGIGDGIRHLAFKSDMPGRVDLWPEIEKSDQPEKREWDDPLDLKGRTNHKVLLAQQIASEIKRMIEHETLPVKGKNDEEWSRRKITAGDVLILVQRRSDLFSEIIAACKTAGLDVAGADRLKLGGELAVKDISALLRFLALPEDDLSLAAALKSPLFGWTEKQLYDLARPRPDGQTLWEALRKSGGHVDTLEVLNDLRKQSDFLRPYDLINRVLIRHDGRRNLLARLGHEAEDGIDALLSQALGYEQSDVPSLTGFLTWLQTEDVTVKRQMDSAGDRIRVMTVHGAKGLEAPIVILPDTTKRKREVRGDLLVDNGAVFWKPKADVMPDSMRAVQETMLDAQDQERRRLLYVALTRAENWLIIAAAGDVGEGQDSWHSTIKDALGHLDSTDAIAPFGPFRRFSRWDWNGGDMIPSISSQPTQKIQPAFGDLLPPIPSRPEIRSPSKLGGAKIVDDDADEDSSDLALAWGRIIHMLLELLPDLPPDSRRATATTLVENHIDAGLIPDTDNLIAEAINVLEASDLAWVFKSGLSEVPISATLPSLNGDRLSGIIDRLIVTDTDVIVIDYKSNRQVPATPQDTPEGLLRQMAAYRDALSQIYPNHGIQTVLLWTKTATTTTLSNSQLDSALKAVTTP